MTFLQIYRKECEENAKRLGDYQNLTINELANGYCDSVDMCNYMSQNQYFCALVLRFWYAINKLYLKHSQSLHLNHEDFLGWIQESIIIACDQSQRVWRKKDTLNAQQCINQILYTRFELREEHDMTFQIRKANYNPIRLDKELDSESGTTSLDLLADDSRQENSYSDALNTVQRFVDDNKIIEAIVLDTIAFSDTDVFKHTSTTIKEVDEETGEEYKYTEKKTKLWEFKLVQTLNELDSDYINYFSDTYQISNEKFAKVFEEMKKATNQKKYKYIDSAIEATRNLCKLVNKA